MPETPGRTEENWHRNGAVICPGTSSKLEAKYICHLASRGHLQPPFLHCPTDLPQVYPCLWALVQIVPLLGMFSSKSCSFFSAQQELHLLQEALLVLYLQHPDTCPRYHISAASQLGILLWLGK